VSSSRRKPNAPASEPGQIATVLVAFAITGFLPIHRRAGKEISVPPPAMELIVPARVAARKMTSVLRRLQFIPSAGEGSPVQPRPMCR